MSCQYVENVDDVEEEQLFPACVFEPSYALVVDDEPAILSVVMLLLETEGYAGIGFSQSRNVLPFLEHLHKNGLERGARLPSVIVLDLMMPGISGYEIITWLREQSWTTNIPVIIMTADHRVCDKSAIPGATALLHKPFHLNELLTLLEQHLLALPVLDALVTSE